MTGNGTISAALVGCTGYIGIQCAALLQAHPDVALTQVVARSHTGLRHCDVVPGSEVPLRIDDAVDAGAVDVVVAALPHTVAARQARTWLSAGAVVVDLSADFRLRDTAAYETWYGEPHPAPELCDEAVYGLVEAHRDALRAADLIAVPGCYPTAALLAVLPALGAGLVEPTVIVDAKSGVSGAGRSPSTGTGFAEVNESVHAYAVDGHRHKPEMLQEMRAIGGDGVQLTFVPHLVPMTRGILATAYMQLRPGVSAASVRGAYGHAYETEPSVQLVTAPPATKVVAGTNRAALHVAVQDSTCVVTVAIDNLVKGGAGQAVQALNIRFGLPESSGLTQTPVWP